VKTRPRIYNPREASPEVLEAMLVGRQPIVDEILADLARQTGAATRQHWLIRGPRGIGKTHLIGIVYHRVKREPGLQTYLPVWLGEAEAYSVYSAAVLLLQIAQQLVVELHQSKDAAHVELSTQIAELEHAGDDPALFEELVHLLREEARRRGKILLVLMENLDAALGGLPGRRGAGQVQRLRSLLSEDRELLFLSTTPTRYLPALADPRQPLYGQLKERTLEPLAEQEVGQLLARLAQVTGEKTLAGFEGSEPEFSVRRRVLHRLTGGNPRAVVMAFSVLTGDPGVQAIVDEMSALIDAQTAYFESRLSQLAARERSIVAAMALAPENLTLQEIAQRSRLPLRSLSVQLKRLGEQGYVLPVAGEGGKGTIYELSDGLFRLWYQFRKGSKILGPIVHFLALWHPLDELERSLTELRSAGEVGPLLQRDLIRLTQRQIEAALELARSEAGRRLRQDLWQECSRTFSALTKEEYLEPTIESIEKLKAYLGHGANLRKGRDKETFELMCGSMLGWMSYRLSRFQEAETILRKVLQADPAAHDETFIPAAMLALGLTLEAQGRATEALDLYRDLQGVPGSKQFAQGILLLGGLSLAKVGPAIGRAMLGDWASRVAAVSINKSAVLTTLLALLFANYGPSALLPALDTLAASHHSEVAAPAEFFRAIAKVAAAELEGKPRRARQVLARVPPELRQTVSELAGEVVAAQREKGAMAAEGAADREGV
jgi:tetratricopeptide (TPR) repeat protein